MAESSLIDNTNKQEIANLIANQIQNVQTVDSTLYKLAKKIMRFYKANFIADANSVRQKTGLYYGYRFTANTQLKKDNQYLSLAESKDSAKYAQKLHTLQGYIQQFLSEFMNRPQTQYVIYYEDKEGFVYRKEFSSKEEQQLFTSQRAQALTLSPKALQSITKSIKDTQIQAQFSEHYNNYMKQLDRVYSELKSKKTYAKKFSRQQFNKGIKAEAFERHFQKIHNGQIEQVTDNTFNRKEIKENILESFGFTPWWTTGDVMQFQVKAFSDDSKTLSAGSIHSLEELLNFINILSNKGLFSSVDINRIAKTVVRGLLDKTYDKAIEESVIRQLNKTFPQN